MDASSCVARLFLEARLFRTTSTDGRIFGMAAVVTCGASALGRGRSGCGGSRFWGSCCARTSTPTESCSLLVRVPKLNITASGRSPSKGEFNLVLGPDITYVCDSHDALVVTCAALLDGSGASSPRIVLAHKHRHCKVALDATLAEWDEGDVHLSSFAKAASTHGLVFAPL